MPRSASAVSGRKNITLAAPWMNIGSAMVCQSALMSNPARMNDTSAKMRNPRLAIRRASTTCSVRPISGAKHQREHAEGHHHHARPDLRVAHVLLQPQRQHHDGAEEHRVAHRQRRGAGPEVAVAQQVQVHDRVRVVEQLPGEEQREAHCGGAGERDDLARGEPVQLLALVQHDLQRGDPDRQQHQAHHVHRHALPRRLAVAVQQPDHRRRRAARPAR